MKLSPILAPLKRLHDMRAAWNIAAENYFDPEQFRRNLQNCLMTSRTVTFILQAQKAQIRDFDNWYGDYQEKWKSDAIMRWAVDSRNKIEKQGDLATNSQVKLSIVASHVGGPETEWSDAPLFYPTIRFWMGLPERFLKIPQVFDHGTLVVARRWVADSLPDYEVLEALSYVYKQLSILLQDCEKHLGISNLPIRFEHEPQEMRPLAMERAEYVSIRTGQVFGHRIRQVPVDKDFRRKAVKRYEKLVDWTPLQRANSFQEIASAIFAEAQKVLKRDGFHSQIAFLFKEGVLMPPIAWDHEDRAAKYLFVRDMADYARSIGADGVLFLGEAWLAKKEDAPASGFAAEAKNRLECLSLTGANSEGACFMMQSVFHRGKLNRNKIVSFDEVTFHSTKLQFMVAQFQLNWGVISLQDIDDFSDDSEVE